MSELKRCPLCNKEIEVTGGDINWKPTFYDPDSGDTGLPYIIKCECGLTFSIGRGHSLDELFERWNTRKPMQNIVKRLEENLQKIEEKRKMAESEADKLRFFNFEMALRKAISIVKEEGGIDGSNL